MTFARTLLSRAQRHADDCVAAARAKVTPVRAIAFTKISVALACAWPPSPETTGRRVALYKAWWCACCLSSVLLLLPLLSSIYVYRNDPVILAKSVCLSCAVLQVTVKMVVCCSRHTRFQAIYHEMETFCKQADDRMNVTLQRYVDRYKRTYGIYTLWCYLTAIGVICGPLVLPQQFPTHAKYPFFVDRQPMKSVVYLHQSLVGLQVAAGMSIDCVIAILLFYSAARLELLAREIRGVKSERDLDRCIELHGRILKYTAEVGDVVRPLILTTMMTTTMAVVFGSLNMVTDQPIVVKVQYSVVVFSASMELLVCALPADNLMHMSSGISSAAFESQWYKSGISMRRKTLQMIFRSQQPAVIRINGVFPALSLSYYAKFLYTSFSYFTAVRIMVQ